MTRVKSIDFHINRMSIFVSNWNFLWISKKTSLVLWHLQYYVKIETWFWPWLPPCFIAFSYCSVFSMTDGNDCESLATAALSVITSNFTIFIIYSAFLYNLQNNCGGGENNSYFWNPFRQHLTTAIITSKMGLNLRKFWVLTWKTLIVKGRHYIETFLDLIVPTFLFMILAVLRYQGGDFLKPTNQPDEIFDTNQFLKKICDVRSDYNATFYYAPAGGAVDDLMNKVIQANEYFEYGGCSYSQNFTILSK